MHLVKRQNSVFLVKSVNQWQVESGDKHVFQCITACPLRFHVVTVQFSSLARRGRKLNVFAQIRKIHPYPRLWVKVVPIQIASLCCIWYDNIKRLGDTEFKSFEAGFLIFCAYSCLSLDSSLHKWFSSCFIWFCKDRSLCFLKYRRR